MLKLSLSWLLLLSVPLINFGPITGAKLTFAHFVAVAIVFILAARGKLRLNHPTIIVGGGFIAAVAVVIFATIIFINRVSVLTQLINYMVMFIIMLVSYSLASRSHISALNLLERYYRIGIFLVVLSLFIFTIGIIYPDLVYAASAIFNNANTFDLGGIIATFHLDLLPRLTGLSPEPSFWSIYISTLIAMGFALKRRLASFSMLILFVALLFTFAWTGFVAIAVFFLFQAHRNRPALLFISIPAALIFIALVIEAADFNNINLSVEQRLESLATGWQAFTGSPLFGLGWSGFVEFSKINQLDYPVVFNYYLQIATDGGLFILALLLLFLSAVYVMTDTAFRGVLVVIFASWASVPSYNIPYVWFLFGVLIALKPQVYKQKVIDRIQYATMQTSRP
jgi:hypothetical protein